MNINSRENQENDSRKVTKQKNRENAIDDLCDSRQSSMGIINMDKFKDFSDLFTSNSSVSKNEYYQPQYTTPRPGLNKKSINLSDLVEDQSINSPNNHVFKPSEMSGRSTIMVDNSKAQYCHLKNQSKSRYDNNASPSVEQILAASFSEEVRGLGSALENIKLRQSLDSNFANDLKQPQTADISLSNSIVSLPPLQNEWQKSIRFSDVSNTANVDCSNEKFLSSTEVESVLAQDHKAWKFKYADIPNTSVCSTDGLKSKKEHSPNLSDFSHAELSSNFSMGQFFVNRNEQLYEMIPNKSPKKRNRAVPLYEQSLSRTETFSEEKSPPFTYPKTNDGSVLSVSTIAAQLLNESTNDSPISFTNKLSIIKSPNQMPAASSTAHTFAASPTEILYITKPLPLTTTSKENSNVQVLKVEEFYGHPPLNIDRVKSTNIISADSIRRNRNQSKVDQISDIKKIPFTLTTEDNDKENINSQSDTMSVTESFVEKFDHSSSPSDVKNTDSTMKNSLSCNSVYHNNNATSVDSMKYLSVGSQQLPRQIRSPAKSLNEQFSSMTIEQHSPKQHYHQFSPSPAKSPNQNRSNMMKVHDEERHQTIANRCDYLSPRSAIGSPGSSIQSSSTERYAQHSPSPSKLKYLQPIRSRSRSISPKLLSQYQASQCASSTSSLSSSGDHFGIKSSHGELSWGSTKLRKIVKKTFTIKNIAHRKTSVKLDIVGPGFQLSDGERKILLQSSECRTISITFCPTVIGPAIGKVTLQLLGENANNNVERIIPLYGYGGHTVISVRGIDKGPIGSSYLKMGDTKDLLTGYLERSFIIYNKGPLNAIAVIQLKINQNDFIAPTNIFITPDKCIIPATSAQTITVTCKPNRRQMKKILKESFDVITIATISVISGDEPNQKRLSGVLKRTNSTTDSSTYNSLNFLIFDLPNKNSCADDFVKYTESSKSISDLYNSFRTEDIALTINRMLFDETCNTSDNELLMSGMGETVFFHTMMTNNEDIIDEQQQQQQQQPAITTKSSNNKKQSLTVYPKRLLINPFSNTNCRNNNNTIFIANNFPNAQSFELIGNYRHLFMCTPSMGTIEPGQQIEIDVRIKKTPLPSDQLFLGVYFENDKIDVQIDVDKTDLPLHFKW